MMRLGAGLCSVTFRDLPYAAVLALASEARIEAIEWGSDRHAPVGDLAVAAAIAAASRACGIAVASYGSYYEAGVGPVADFARIAETAQALGAPGIRIWAGRRGIDSKDVTRAERERVVDSLRAVCEIARAAGLDVSLEFHRQTLTDSLASTLDLLQRVASPDLHTYWQARPGIGPDVSRAEVEALRRHLTHVHVFNWNVHRERFPLEAAAEFWEPLLQHVAAWNQTTAPRWAMLEFVAGDDAAAFAQDAATLHAWLRNANERVAIGGPIA